ncbi:nuclear transport factor 2 family protein [Parafrankia sp. BMG5.11]|uniref:nuclear transport factor 2 family protein n=1 Tax=Parafrankia sp. BMG5.11 TaxID=222540 RepID=UPI001039E153|nr:nuclear transport factor 2 family protein [Parafrankia sp. BMG5.11]TCJ37510.1 nuclear transport factor 2 family protein [Parafrankia sp. BMG5.11]
MMTLQEMSDRLEIQDLLAHYSFAIDDRDWDALDGIFTPDARIDYTAAGGIAGSLADIKRWLPVALERFPTFQHMVATTQLRLDGDRASSRTILFNPMVHEDATGTRSTFFIGLWYRDSFVRTVGGWRIAERVEEMGWVKDAPDMPPVPDVPAP